MIESRTPEHAVDDRLRRLREAQRAIGAKSALHSMPARIVDAACTLLGARSGHFVAADAARCECRPDDAPTDAAAQAAQAAQHVTRPADATGDIRGPSCRVALRVRGDTVGEVHLLLPAAGLSAADAELLEAFAANASVALENATLDIEAQRSRDWLHASGEIARSLLSGDGNDSLMDVVLRALHVADADAASLLLPTDDGRLVVAVTAGVGADDYRGYIMRPADSVLATSVALGETMLVTDMAQIMRRGFTNEHDFGPVMSAPLVDASGVRGAVLLIRLSGRPPFTPRELDLASTFADQIALALEMDDSRADGQWLRVVEDRHRIAKDLHDNVMQRLFAIGVGLESLAAAASLPPEIARRLGRYIADLDETIDDIRGRVFGLRDDERNAGDRGRTRFPRVTHDLDR